MVGRGTHNVGPGDNRRRVTVVAGARADATAWVYRATAFLLVSLAGLTALTGARTHVIWFKICPVLLTASAGLLVAASLL